MYTKNGFDFKRELTKKGVKKFEKQIFFSILKIATK